MLIAPCFGIDRRQGSTPMRSTCCDFGSLPVAATITRCLIHTWALYLKVACVVMQISSSLFRPSGPMASQRRWSWPRLHPELWSIASSDPCNSGYSSSSTSNSQGLKHCVVLLECVIAQQQLQANALPAESLKYKFCVDTRGARM